MANLPLPARLQALLLLDGYSRCQKGAQPHYKSTLWTLNKARRQKARENLAADGISVELVREELRARTVLLEKNPDLLEEESKSQNKHSVAQDIWTLVDAVEEISAMKENTSTTLKNNTTTPGLRNRKNANKIKSEDKNKMGVNEEVLPDEDDRLRNADPLLLFGAFASSDLKEAQKEAKATLEAYIQAANLAAAIINLTNEKK